MEGVVAKNHLNFVAKYISGWELLAQQFGFRDNPNNQNKEQIVKRMLEIWKERTGDGATYNALMTALLAIGEREIRNCIVRGLADVVDAETLKMIIGRIAEWKPLFRELGYGETAIKNHEKNLRFDTNEETVKQMLQIWKTERGDDATYYAIMKALLAIGRKDIHDDLDRAFPLRS